MHEEDVGNDTVVLAELYQELAVVDLAGNHADLQNIDATPRGIDDAFGRCNTGNGENTELGMLDHAPCRIDISASVAAAAEPTRRAPIQPQSVPYLNFREAGLVQSCGKRRGVFRSEAEIILIAAIAKSAVRQSNELVFLSSCITHPFERNVANLA